MTKQLLAWLLALVMLFSLLPFAAFAEGETGTVNVGLAVGQSAMYTVTGSYDTYSGGGSVATVELSVSPGTEAAAAAQLGSDANYSGDYVSLDTALFTFAAGESGYTISGTLSDDTTVYLNPAQGSAGYPCNTTEGTVTIAAGDTEGTFSLQGAEGGSGIGRYLYFWRNGNNYFDRYGVTSSPATDFLLYRPAEDGETSSAEIPGYVQVTDTDTITEGSYLILALYNGTYYALYPSASTSDKYSHVAAVRVFEAEPAITTVTITGVAAGSTSVTVGDTTFNITIAEPVCTDAATGVAVDFGAAFVPGMTVTPATVAALEGATYTAYDITPEGYTGSAQVTIPLTEELEACETLTGFVVEHGSIRFITGTRNGDGYTFTTPHFSLIGVTGDAATVTVAVNGTATYVIAGSNYAGTYEADDPSIATVEVTGTDAQESIETYTVYDATCSELVSGRTSDWTATSYYYTPDDGTNYYPVYAQRTGAGTYTYTWGYSTTGSSSNVTQIGTQSSVSAASTTTANITVYKKSTTIAASDSTTIVFKGLAAGTTAVTVGGTTYTIHVLDVLPTTETVTIGVGETVIYTDDSGNYTGGLSDSVAAVTVTGTPATRTLGSRLAAPAVNTSQTGLLTDGQGHYLTRDGTTISTTDDIDQAAVWTVTCTGTGTYTIQSDTFYLVYTLGTNGKANGLSVSESNSNGTWNYNPTYGFSVYTKGTYYLRYNTGWQLTTSTTTGSAGQLYSFTEGGAATTVTITGVAPGSTAVTVGNTTYDITVTGDTPVEPTTEEVSVALGDVYTVSGVTDDTFTGLDNDIITATLSGGTLTITGKAPGSTSVTVGSVTYNITVYTEKQVNLAPKGIHTFHGVEGNLDLGNMDPNIANAEKKEDASDPRLVITAKDKPGERTDFMMGYIKFIVNVIEKDPVDVTLKVGESQEFSTSATDITQDYNANYVTVELTAAGSADAATLSLGDSEGAAAFALSDDETTNTLTFTGKAVGNTEVTVGDTVYNVTVEPASTETTTVDITLAPYGVYTVDGLADSTLDDSSLDTAIATATLSDGTLTITGVAVGGPTSVTVGSTQYNITVTGDNYETVTVAVGKSVSYASTATAIGNYTPYYTDGVATATLNGGNLIITGVKAGTTAFAVGDTIYFVTVTEAEESDAPSGTTQDQPFSSGTGGSTNFRIPALITLSNGTLLAACDARYTGSGDGYGLDTVVSYSTDGGSTWNYSFVNYFDDSASYSGSASAFIDPVLIQGNDGTVYLFTDLYPGGGYYIANIKSGTGFVTVDGVSYLALYDSTSATSSTTPSYYVANELNGDGYYTVYDYSTKTASNYALSPEYDIYTVSNGIYTSVTGTQIDNSSNTIKANVFYTGTANASGLYVLGTEYITMRKGTVNADGSISWGGLKLLNVKADSEYFYGVGPGGGTVTSTGRIIVPMYTYANGSDGNTSVIYSDDGGKTWTRSADMNVQTSEGSISEVTVGGKTYLYMFTRHGGYFVSEDNGETWSTQKAVDGISYTTSCELSTLTYSQTIDGCPAILLSAPTSGRTTGKIFVGLVQEDGSINWAYTYEVNGSDFYAYSDLAELDDGSIGLLYENGSTSITYTNLAIETIAPDAQMQTVDVIVYVGQTKTLTDKSGNYENSYNDEGLDKNIALVTVNGAAEVVKDISEVTSLETNKQYLILSNRANKLLTSGSATTNASTTGLALKGELSADSAECWTITVISEESDGTYNCTVQNSDGQYLTIGGKTASVSDDSATLNLAYANDTWTITQTVTDGVAYLNDFGNEAAVAAGWINSAAPTDAGSQWRIYEITESSSEDTTAIEITGVAPGKTSVTVGNTTYNITVLEVPEVVDSTNTPFVANTGTGDGKAVTKLTTSVGLTFDLDLNVTGTNIEWSVADPSIATVDQNGNVTGVSKGTTYVIATVDGVPFTIPVVIREDATSTSTLVYDFYISTIKNTTAYYVLNCTTELVQVQEGEAIYISVDSGVGTSVDFYGAQDDGYALTYMSSTNSAGNYYGLNSTDPSQTEFYTSGAPIASHESSFGTSAVLAMIQAAIDAGCDGAMGWNRTSSNTSDVTSDLIFVSQKLAEVKKELTSVTYNNGANYRTTDFEGNWGIKLNDTINYTITITIPAFIDEDGDGTADYGSISYSNLYLTDVMLGDESLFASAGGTLTYTSGPTLTVTTTDTNGNTTDTTITAGQNTVVTNGSLICSSLAQDAEDIVLTFTASVELTLMNYEALFGTDDTSKDNTITNSAVFTFDSSSLYTQSIQSSSADATVISAYVWYDTYVVDFGLPVTIDMSNAPLMDDGEHILSTVTSRFSDNTATIEISEDGKSITYTLNKPLREYDQVTYKVQSTTSNDISTDTFSIYIIPASNVLYEASFLSQASGSSVQWAEGSKNSSEQTPPDQESLYGYDSIYSTSTGQLGSAWTVTGLNKSTTVALETSFYGIGFDLIGTCGPNTGMILVVALNQNDASKSRSAIVDTRINDDLDGDSENDTLYQVPIVHLDLEEGLYNVKVFASYLKASESRKEGTYAAIDGFRIYRSTANPGYLLAEQNTQYVNVLDAAIKSGAVYVESSDDNFTLDVAEYKGLGGPQNEIYLRAGSAVAFQLDGCSAGDTVQVSARAVTANAAKLSDGSNSDTDNITIAANTEMYYKVTVGESGLLTLTNTGSGMLALGFLKLPDGVTSTEPAAVQMAAVFSMVRRSLAVTDETEESEDVSDGTGSETGTVIETPAETEAFRPEVMELETSSYTLDGEKCVTLTVVTSTDVSKLTINGTAVWASNLTQVRQGLEQEYRFTMLLRVPANETAIFEVVAYDQNGQTSISYTKLG